MAGDNRIVTENFLRLNFTPKAGITPGMDDLIGMSCDQVKARYNVNIAGATSTGNRIPGQNQISSAALNHPFTYLGKDTASAQTGNPVNRTFTIDSSAKLLIVTVKAIFEVVDAGAPTWNGVTMSTAVSNSRSGIWYLINPDTGTHTLTIANSGSVNYHVASAWFSCDGTISFDSTATLVVAGTSTGNAMTIPTNSELLMIDAVCFQPYTGSSLGFVSHSDVSIYSGVGGGSAGSASQYKIFNSGINTSYTLSWVITMTMQCYNASAVFKST